MSRVDKEKREYARVPVEMSVRLRPLDEEEARRACDELLLAPSVWGPANETALRDMVAGSSDADAAILAQAVLDLTAQVVLLRGRVLNRPESMLPVELLQVSGGGGKLRGRLPLRLDDTVEIHFENDDGGLPPMRCVATIVHREESPEGATFGFAFRAIHPHDQERLIRAIYRVQREALRRTHDGSLA